MANCEIKITDNSSEIKGIFNSQLYVALETCGLKAEGYAKGLCPTKTGNLKNSITHKVVSELFGKACYIGTNVDYGKYVEFGTGEYAELGNGRKSPWVYQDDSGKWHKTNGQKAQPFVRPAISDHTDIYKRIIESELKK